MLWLVESRTCSWSGDIIRKLVDGVSHDHDFFDDFKLIELQLLELQLLELKLI